MCCLALACGSIAFAQNKDRVMQEALSPSSPLQENLRVLTDEIGGRVPGTPQYARAVQWGIDRFKQAGADSVHTESFTIAQSWAEGATELSIVEPTQFRVRSVAMGWTPAVPHTTARVLDVGDGTTADFAKAGNVAGAVLLVHNKILEKWDDLFDEYLRAPAIIDQAVKAKALALVFISSREHDVLYRHQNSMNGRIEPIGQVLIAREDGLRIARLLGAGKPVRMSISVPNKIGPQITTQNVVADLKGSELPNEQVILGAHLDSWELGTGALDNGCNSALVIDTLRVIKAAGVKPRRTIRFILFGGEEQGMLGSKAYVKAHQAELDNVVGEIVIDSGIGAFTGFSTGGRKDLDAPLQPLLAPFAEYKATDITNDGSLGTDNFDFMLEGVPTVTPNQVEANYMKNYHATSDTFDKVDFDQLKKNEAITAELAVELANAPQRIGPRLTRKQIEATFSESHLDDQMKGFNVWEEWASGARGRKD